MYTLPPTVYTDPLFLGEVSSHVLNFEEKKRKSDRYLTARSGIIVIVIGRQEFHLEYIFTIRYDTQVPNFQLTTGTDNYLPK